MLYTISSQASLVSGHVHYTLLSNVLRLNAKHHNPPAVAVLFCVEHGRLQPGLVTSFFDIGVGITCSSDSQTVCSEACLFKGQTILHCCS